MIVATLSSRKVAETARRQAAVYAAMRELRTYARERGVHFVVFGSSVDGRMRFDSDFDVMVEGPLSLVPDAWQFAETVCGRLGLPVDLHDAATSRPDFVDRVRRTGTVLE